jgi:hypothetical protein
MEAIGNLDGLRRRLPGALSKRPAAIATDDLDAGPAMSPQPPGERGRFPVRQEIDHPMRLQVHQDGAIPRAASKREVVDSKEAQRGCRRRRARHLDSPDEPEQRVAAHPRRAQAQLDGEPPAGLTTQRETDRLQTPLQGPCTPLIAGGDLGQRLAEGLLCAGGIEAAEPSRVHH